MSDHGDFLRKLFADPETERITLAGEPVKAAEDPLREFTRNLFANSED